MTTYKDSGVDIDAAEKAIMSARGLIESTYTHAKVRVLSKIGGFSGIVEHPGGMVEGYTCDGVGSKMALAVYMDSLDTIGTDLVAANANDLLVCGLEPKVLLDYIGTGKIHERQMGRILESVAEACRYSRIALLGGETAEMPVLYDEKDYDLVGFAAGSAISRAQLVLGNGIKPGMNLYGLASSGVHNNGFHLIYDAFGIALSGEPDDIARCGECISELGGTRLSDELLRPSEIYVSTIAYLRAKYRIAGMAHITGGGLTGNIPRILPDGCAAEIAWGSWDIPRIFSLIQKRGTVSDDEMLRVFNNGIGIVVVSPDDLTKDGAFFIGKIIASNEKHKVFFI